MKIRQMSMDDFFVIINRLFAFFYSNEDKYSKRYKAKRFYLPKNCYNVFINGKSSMNNASTLIYSNTKK